VVFDIYFVFSCGIFVINVISFFCSPIYTVDISIHVAAFFSYVSGLCNVVQWDCGMSTVKCCDNKKVQQVFY
jgi:hypothetical protein